MRFLRLAAFVNAFYPKYFYAPQQFRSFFQFFRLRCSFFSFASRLRTSLHCWSKVHILIPEVRFLPFNLHIDFRFFNAFRFLPLLVEGTVPLALRCCSATASAAAVAVVPLPPLPLFTTNLVHAQGWFLNFLIFFCIFFILFYVL